VSFVAITLCVASQRVITKISLYFVTTQSGNFWIHPHILQSNDMVKVKFFMTFLKNIIVIRITQMFGTHHIAFKINILRQKCFLIRILDVFAD